MASVWTELRRRNVVKVAVAYAIVGWLLVEVASVVLPTFKAPEWIMQVFTFLVIVGFPLALILAWAFELTPEGIKREKDVDRSQSITQTTGRKLDYFIIAVLVLALGFFAFDKFVLGPSRDADLVQATTEAVTEQASESKKSEIPDNSIAVLPFVNMSSDPEQGYFSDGISEELLNVLVHVDGLRVASRTSSFACKGGNKNLAEIADILKVSYLLEGSVRKAGNRVRITAQLIEAASDRHLWSEIYERDLTDIFAIKSEIANAIVAALRDSLGLEVASEISVLAATTDMNAYDSYLKGRELFIARTDLERSVELFEQAVAGVERKPLAGEREQFELAGFDLGEQRNVAQQLDIFLQSHIRSSCMCISFRRQQLGEMGIGLVEFVECARLDDAAALHDQNIIEQAGLARPVQNPDQSAALEFGQQIGGDLRLAGPVERRGRLGQYEHVGALEHGAGDGQLLTLGG